MAGSSKSSSLSSISSSSISSSSKSSISSSSISSSSKSSSSSSSEGCFTLCLDFGNDDRIELTRSSAILFDGGSFEGKDYTMELEDGNWKLKADGVIQGIEDATGAEDCPPAGAYGLSGGVTVGACEFPGSLSSSISSSSEPPLLVMPDYMFKKMEPDMTLVFSIGIEWDIRGIDQYPTIGINAVVANGLQRSDEYGSVIEVQESFDVSEGASKWTGSKEFVIRELDSFADEIVIEILDTGEVKFDESSIYMYISTGSGFEADDTPFRSVSIGDRWILKYDIENKIWDIRNEIE